jgi:dolichyl-phosphate-mannose-protein mannosyltransferase
MTSSVETAPPVAPVPVVPEARGSRLDDWFERTVSTPFRRRLWEWAAPVAVTLLAVVLRVWNLGHPSSLVFDETFYVKDAWTQWNLGYASKWPEGADERFNAGDVNAYLADPSFVVHPQLGKYLIGLPMWLFGADNPAAWRIGTVVAGVAAVVLIMVIAKKLFGATSLAVLAGFLLAIEGNAIVMSRVALLDNFVMFFALLGVLFVILDRGWASRRLSSWVERRAGADRSIDWGPALWWRPWLIAAGVAFGLCTAVKWNGLYFLAVFAVYTVLADALARRRAGLAFWLPGTVLKQAPVTFVLMVPTALAVYLVTWISWFTSDNSYGRHWSEDSGLTLDGPLGLLPTSLQNFIHYEQDVYRYHVGESRPHPYQANPLTWLLLLRPTSMYYLGNENGVGGCTAPLCGESVTGLANPIIWWAGAVAVLFLVYRFVLHREWRVGIILLGMLAGYVPWMLYLGRTVFQFYSIAFEPYLILALVFGIGLLLGSRRDPRRRRTQGLIAVGLFLLVAIAATVYFWPLWTAVQLDYGYLASHWWLPGWR